MKGILIPALIGGLFVAVVVLLVRLLARLEAWWIQRKKRPSVGPFRFVRAVSERKENDMDIIKYKVGLPESLSGDVVKRELIIRRSDTGDGLLEAEQKIETSMMELEFEAVQDSQVDLSCVAIDDNDNVSMPVQTSFVAVDTVAPDLSGEFTIRAIGERTEPSASAEATADKPETTPAEEPPPAGEAGPDEAGAAEADAEKGEPTGEPPTDPAAAGDSAATGTPGD